MGTQASPLCGPVTLAGCELTWELARPGQAPILSLPNGPDDLRQVSSQPPYTGFSFVI